ncbi:MAG: flagellar basal body P-ring protein FlgI [Desulfohalobiaceae bacterium]
MTACRRNTRPLFQIRSLQLLCSAVLTLFFCLVPTSGRGEIVRLKDIASFSGVRSNELVGYGLVVGLLGTGDKSGTEFTVQSVVNMLENMGVRVDKGRLKVKNVAAVMVTGKMPVSAKPGTRLDVTVSSIGDASSLLGGVLLMTPLKGIDGKVYALAQGPVAVGGVSALGEAAEAVKNITTVAKIPNGAVVEKAVPFAFNTQDSMTINLDTSDFGTTMQVVERINTALGRSYARAENISTVVLDVPGEFSGNIVPLMASLENLEVSPDRRAKVVVDEKTGTVVLGGNVRLSQVAVAHGNLQVVVQETPEVSQPEPFGEGQTAVVPRTEMLIQEENQRLVLLEGARLQELVNGLNAIGATPRDLISILRTLKSAGALHAELEVL